LNKELDIQERELEKIKKELQKLTEKIPNLPAPDTPLKENKIIDETRYN